MYLDIFSWVFVVTCILGTILVNRRRPAGYYFWTVSNVGLIAINVYINMVPQAVMFAVGLVLSIDGIRQERKRNPWRYVFRNWPDEKGGWQKWL